jgi:tRNA modification GTPase
MAQAQLLLKVLDAAAPLEEEDLAVLNAAAGIPHVVVLNKIDLPQIVSDKDVLRLAAGGPILKVSATERQGLRALRQAVIGQFFNGDGSAADAPVLTSVRHRDALHKVLRSLALARESIAEGRPADLVAVDVQDAIDHIGAITGQVTSEDILDRIFSEFCIGK